MNFQHAPHSNLWKYKQFRTGDWLYEVLYIFTVKMVKLRNTSHLIMQFSLKLLSMGLPSSIDTNISLQQFLHTWIFCLPIYQHSCLQQMVQTCDMVCSYHVHLSLKSLTRQEMKWLHWESNLRLMIPFWNEEKQFAHYTTC